MVENQKNTGKRKLRYTFNDFHKQFHFTKEDGGGSCYRKKKTHTEEQEDDAQQQVAILAKDMKDYGKVCDM